MPVKWGTSWNWKEEPTDRKTGPAADRRHVQRKTLIRHTRCGGNVRAFLICAAFAAAAACLIRACPAFGAEQARNRAEKRLIDMRIGQMTAEEKTAQLFVVTPEALTHVSPVTQAGEITQNAIISRPVGGLVFFEDNLQSAEQIRLMLQNMQQFSYDRIRLPLFTCIDEEGGRVTRIANRGFPGFPDVPSMSEVGREGELSARQWGLTIGTYLKELGFNVDLAPVADTATNPANTVIADRSFGSDPVRTAQMTAAFTEGLKEGGVGAVLKHFPGHGDTQQDSHTSAAISGKTKEELENCEFLPFIRGIEAGADMVMVGHISLPELTGDMTPASLSEMVMTDLLRDELGFTGLIITDAMNMAAVADTLSSGEAAVTAFLAGADLILMPADFESAWQGMLTAVRSGVISEERLNASLRRILKLKMKLSE